METIHLINKKVLIVEENPEISGNLEDLLRNLGINAISKTGNAYETLQFFDKTPYWADIVICNWDIPGMPGVALFRELRTTHPKLPFIIMTSRQDAESVLIARDTGVDGYLVNPLSAEELEKKMVGAFRKIMTQAGKTNELVGGWNFI